MSFEPVVAFEQQVEVPLGLSSLEDFRRWLHSDRFPQRGRIDYIAGRIEVDMSPEDLYFHGKLKGIIFGTLFSFVSKEDLGELYTDCTRITSPLADLSAEPDIVFVSNESLNSGRVRPVPRASQGPDQFIEFSGGPDLVVEIVSDGSIAKDTQRLPVTYFQACVSEYWLVDPRGEQLQFEILRRGADHFESAEIDPAGFQYSGVFARWFHLERFRNRHGRLSYVLQLH